MTFQEIDRWLLNNVFARSRRFKVQLSDCIDEFGNSFGETGTHFFIRALAMGEADRLMYSHLKDYYASNPIRCFNEIVGRDIGDDAGTQYFCPWEADRIRPLSRFIGSHKIGPTPDEALVRIVNRLRALLLSIRRRGYTESGVRREIPRVIGFVNQAGVQKFIIRDGQHRSAVLSYLGWRKIFVCYEADYWQPSPAFRWLQQCFGCTKFRLVTHPRDVCENDAGSWPHVREGRVTQDDAVKFFRSVFDCSTVNKDPSLVA
jgi:hypothetical protein